MTDRNTCTCRGYAAMHKPHPHADRDGSEARAQLEREHERALAAYVPEDEPGEVERLRSIEFVHQGCQMLREKDNAYLIDRAEKAEAALARVEALADEWGRASDPSWAKLHAGLLRAALRNPDAEAAS